MRALLLAAFFLPALGLSEVEAQGVSTDTFVNLSGRTWLTLDPANAADAVSFIVVGNVYETLIALKDADGSGGFEPFLATEVPSKANGLISADGLTYTFPIRKGVRFHDGSLMTPEDVRYSLMRFLLTDTEGGPASLLLRPILGVYGTRDSSGTVTLDFAAVDKAITAGDDKVVIHLKQPDATFLKIVASVPLVTSQRWAKAHGAWDGSAKTWKSINNRNLADSYFHEHMNGTGPFKLAKLEPDGSQLVLERNNDYWRAPAALRRVVMRVVPNGGLRLLMLETGDADMAYVENAYRDHARALKGVQVVEEPKANSAGEMLFFNFKIAAEDNDLLGSGRLDGRGIPPDFLADADVRRGVAYAFDYAKYAAAALGGRGQRENGPIPPALFPAGAPAYEHDPQKALEAFKKAFGGEVWKNGFVVPVLYSEENVTRQIAAETLRDSLQELNPKFKVHLHPLPNAEFYQTLEAHKAPLYIAGYYADYPDPQAFVFGLLHSRGYFPRTQGFQDPQADALVEDAERQDDADARAKDFAKLTALAAKDVPQVYTYSPLPFRVCRDWVVGCETRSGVNNLGYDGFPYFYSFSKKSPD